MTEVKSASQQELAVVDRLLAKEDRATVAVSERVVVGGIGRSNERRHLLLPGLWELQESIGWISPAGLNALCEALGVPPAEAYGVATFYDLLMTELPSEVLVRQCDDLACMLAPHCDIGPSGQRVGSGCLGQCDSGRAAVVQRIGKRLEQVAEVVGSNGPVVAAPSGARLLSRVIDEGALTLERYRALGGYRALNISIELGPSSVVQALISSGLQGRGGAAFPTGQKWQAVATHPNPMKHVIANADESEPGTFKDRVLMENDPFALIEALTICGLAVGAENGWIYVRGEYPIALQRLQSALSEARVAGLLGSNVAGSEKRFDIEIRRGGGAYICGEETALLESIEGYRGEPRNKPPYPTTNGLFGHPTVINNVETLVNVLDILIDTPDVWRAVGTKDSPGTRLFCLSGHVARPGVYEHPMGTTLQQVLDAAGGMAGDRALQMILLGGAAGIFVPPESCDVELSFEGARSAGVTLGSGVVMAFDDTVDLSRVLARAGKFFAHESCGQCVPCRIGTQRQMELLDTLAPDLELLAELDQVMTDSSICGLGQTAAALVRSARQLGVI